ncbi:MAG: hypothetical protein JXA73_09160 [Acidobacteria bacterium]|nr:hypothetical protein [Acidobacteriota bacterium]
MDIPGLRYLDVLIGLGVVMVLGTTLVAAITQFILSGFYFRSRTLRKGLQELIEQLDPSQITSDDARKISERLLRHPLLARPNSWIGLALNRLYNLIRTKCKYPKLPSSNPADVIQRGELVMLLMEWASNEGPLIHSEESTKPDNERLQKNILQMFVNNGIGDPAGTLRSVRIEALANENRQPELPAHMWLNKALIQEAASNFLGKVNNSFDNAIMRVSQAFKLKAQIITCVLSFFVAFAIQLDSISLVKRLSIDDKLRDSLVAEARLLVEQIEKSEKGKGLPENKSEVSLADKTVQQTPGVQEEISDEAKAKAALAEIESTLSLLRQPRLAIIPNALLWEKHAQTTLCADTRTNWAGTLHVGTQAYTIPARSEWNIDSLEEALIRSQAPIYVYRIDNQNGKCLMLVSHAAADNAGFLKFVSETGAPIPLQVELKRNYIAVRRAFMGIFLSGVLLSLGTPFWFNLLKRLLSLRSALAYKDDKERAERANQAKKAKAAATAASDPNTKKTVQHMDGEMGDLNQTGAVG